MPADRREWMRVVRGLRWLALAAAFVVAAILVVRGWQALRDPALAPWHTFAPPEAGAEAIAAMTWADWLAQEEALFAAVRAEVVDPLDPRYQTPENRYFAGSPLYPGGFAIDWNRSFTLEPDGPPRGAVVLVHGLTDAPFSLRHVAELYRDAGFVAVAPRMPGHGTTPGGLGVAVWPEWLAATRLAVREAVARAGPEAPLHLVGYSNGGALVTKYALEATRDPTLAAPDQLVLLSPMIGITRFARFAGVAGWPAAIPGFLRAAWFDLIPEFNPFKYNSFPVQAAVQSHRLTVALQRDLAEASARGAIDAMPPVLAFQSVVDFTVLTRAVVDELFARLPANGSALVLADLNRASTLAPLLSAAAEAELGRILPPPPRRYAVTVITNAGPEDLEAVADVTPAGATGAERVPLGLAYPADVFSLSHVALPFPVTDGLYGLDPDPGDDFGISIGTLAARGETGVISVGSDMFARLYSNPFYDAMAARIAAIIPDAP
jgi:alpha-beta hydrolase superfamily lysophospholipase